MIRNTCSIAGGRKIVVRPRGIDNKPATVDGRIEFELIGGRGTFLRVDDNSGYFVGPEDFDGQDPENNKGTMLISADSDLNQGPDHVRKIEEHYEMTWTQREAASLGVDEGDEIPKDQIPGWPPSGSGEGPTS